MESDASRSIKVKTENKIKDEDEVCSPCRMLYPLI